MILTLDVAQTIIRVCLFTAEEMKLKPVTVAVVDGGGHLKALARQDGTSTLRPEIAQGKAKGAVAMGLGSRALFERAQAQPFFIQAMNELAGGALVPVPGGVLVRFEAEIVGAVGITGDSSDNDEHCAVVGIESAGFTADPG